MSQRRGRGVDTRRNIRMLLPRHHEQTRVCRPAGPGRQTLSGRLGTATARTLIAAVCTSVALTAGAAPVLAQPAQESTTQGSEERVHQTLASSVVEEAISAARSQTGTPYAWGEIGIAPSELQSRFDL